MHHMTPLREVLGALVPPQPRSPEPAHLWPHAELREQLMEAVYGHAVGLDMTRRDLQLDARDKGRPWEFGKSFAKSAPIGALHRAQDTGHPVAATISVTVNGQPRQSSDIAKLIRSVAQCVANRSACETLEPGDIILTGTPEGVNAVVAGDLMRGEIQGLGAIEVKVTG